MPYDDILCSWLVRSALVSLTILLIGSGAVLIWRQPLRRVRIIELVLAGCLIAPWLGLIPGYPQFSVVRSQATAIQQQEAPLPPSEPMIEPAMIEPPMPLPTMDRAAPAVSETKIVEAPAHAFEIRPWIIGIYLAGVVIGAGWWLVGIAGLVRLLWSSQPAPSRCRDLLAEISGGRGDRVRLLVNRRLSQPFASAWGRAVIVLPENLCGDEQTLRWCLAHEWAHVDGHDFRTWLLAGLAKVLFFYQPLLWWLRRQLRLCQDFVADSQAALQAADVEDYAEFLTSRVATGRLNPALGLSMGCHKSEIYRRVIMLLTNESLESRTPRLWTVSITVAALVLVGVVAGVSLVPRAVAEEKPQAAAKPADLVSPAKDQTATKEGSKTESKPSAIKDRMSAAWRARQERLRSARFEWKQTELIPAGTIPWLPRFGGTRNESTKEKLELLPRTDTSVESTTTVLFNSSMLRMDRQGSYWNHGRGEVQQDTYISTFDGHVAKSFFDEKSTGELLGLILSVARNQDFDNRNLLPIALTCRPCDLDMGGRYLPDYTVSPGMETINGRACEVIDCGNETLWLDPQRDFLAVRIQHENAGTFDISYQEDQSLGWVPSGWKWVFRSKTGRLFGQTVAKVIAYNIGTDIPKSAFQFEFPVGTYVSDLRMADIYSRSYIVRQGGKKRIITKEELRRGAGADYKELLSTESGMARGKSGDQSGNPSAAKPADAVSPASDQSATKEGAKGESKPAPAHGLAEPNADRTAEIGEASTDTTKHDDPPKATKHLPLVRVFDYMLSHYSNTTINNKRIEKELIGQVYSDIVKVEDVKEFELEHDPDQYLYVEARLPENKYNGCKVGLIFDKKSTKAEVYKAAAELTKGARISIGAKLYKLIFSAASNDEAALGTLASKNEARFTGVEWLEIVSDQRGQKADVQVIAEEKAAVSHAPSKPAGEVPPASDQPATKEGSRTESKPAPAHPLTAEPNTDQAKAIAEIEKLGGKVTVDEKGPGKPVIWVNLENTKVTNTGLANLKGFAQLKSLNLTATNVTNAGLSNLEVLSQLQQLFLNDTKVTDAGLEHLKNLNQLQKLYLCNTKVTDAGLASLAKVTTLQWLDLAGTQITDAGLANLEGLSELQQLFLNDTKVTDAGLEHLKALAKLQWLYLGNTKVTDIGLKNLKGLTQLVFLGLYETNVTDAGLEHVEVLTQLRGLQLEGPTITDAGLQRLKGLSQLQHLTLRNTQVTDAGLEHLKGLTQLVVLVLDGTKVTDDGLEHLKGLTRLTCLLLKGTKVTDAGLKCLTGLTQFKELDLNGTKVTDAGLEYLTGLIQLRELELNETKVTDAGLKHLTGLTHLQQLGLNGTKVTDAGLEHLKGLTHLLALRLDGTKITDAGLEHLEGLTQLGELYLTSTKVTDAGLEHLKGLAQLKILQLAGTPVTDEGVKKLQQALPNCEISR